MKENLVQVELEGGGKSAPIPMDKTIVRIGSRYYKKDCSLVTLVRVSDRRKRYFRKVSPLITEINGQYYTKKSVIPIESCDYKLSKYSPEVVKCADGIYRLKEKCVEANGEWLSLKQESVISCYISRKTILKKDAIKARVNGDEVVYLDKEFADIAIPFKGDHYLRDVCIQGYNGETDEFGWIPRAHIASVDTGTIFNTFNTSWSGDLSRMVTTNHYAGCTKAEFTKRFKRITAIASDATSTAVTLKEMGYSPLYVRREEEALFINSILYHLDSNNGSLTQESFDKFAKILGTNTDFDSNKASTNFRNFGASQIEVRNSKQRISHDLDPEFCELPFTVGIEVETSGGAISTSACQKMGLGKVGDRSVGAYEYITPILGGTEISKTIDEMSKEMVGKVMLDKRCATHVHVGGYNIPTLTKILTNQKFSMLALRLGAKLEDEWFSMLPKFRHSKRYHCYSIKGYKNINEQNADAMLGAYMFGGHESGLTAYDRLTRYSLRRGGNGGRWSGGRYKWLNVTNCLTGNNPTVEFRLFPSVNESIDLKHYTLMSMLFVEFILRYPDEIMKELYKVDWTYIVNKLVSDTKLKLKTLQRIKNEKQI